MGLLTLSKIFTERLIVVDASRIGENTQFPELLVKRPLGKCGLRNVGSVQVIHTIGPDNTSLHLDGLVLVRSKVEVPGPRVRFQSSRSTKSKNVIRSPMPIDVISQPINKHRNTVPAHIAAFAMEVKVFITNLWQVQLWSKE